MTKEMKQQIEALIESGNRLFSARSLGQFITARLEWSETLLLLDRFMQAQGYDFTPNKED